MTIGFIRVKRSRIIKWKAKNVLYLFLFLLPVIWTQNKTVQMAVEVAVLISMLLIEKKPGINKITLPVLFYAAVHVYSILFNIYTSNESIDSSRVVAAFNTAFIWILGCLALSSVIRIKLNYRRINRLMTFLYWVVIAESLLAVVAFRVGKHIYINERSLFLIEWFNEANRIRSYCWMEYASLVPFLLFCVLPYVYIGIDRKKPVVRIMVMAASLLPLYLCNSRLGMVLVIALVGYMTIVEMWKHRVLKIAFLAFCFLLIAFAILKREMVAEKIGSLINKLLFGRGASNTTRTMLYNLTWEKIRETSLLFGAGIKHITAIVDVPLGSHSTYLGAIYKAGIIGAAFLFYFFANIVKRIHTMVQKKEINAIFLFSLLGVFALMIMEDIDGANWMHFLFFIHLGIMMNLKGTENTRGFRSCCAAGTAPVSEEL